MKATKKDKDLIVNLITYYESVKKLNKAYEKALKKITEGILDNISNLKGK